MASTSLTSTTGQVFNPDLTSKEIIDIREANLGFEATASRKYVDAGVGTTLSWPTITAATTRSKSEGNDGSAITFEANVEGEVVLTINTWTYAAFEYEEFEKSLSLHDQKEIYTKRSVYAVNASVDAVLAGLVDNFSQTVGTLGVDLTDEDVRRAVQYLDDANVPGDDRWFAMSPASKNSMLGIERYTSSDFNRGGGANIIKGSVGEIYNLKVFNSTQVEGSNAAGHDNGIYHQDSFALGMRMQPK